jgi:hypothetical protein
MNGGNEYSFHNVIMEERWKDQFNFWTLEWASKLLITGEKREEEEEEKNEEKIMVEMEMKKKKKSNNKNFIL